MADPIVAASPAPPFWDDAPDDWDRCFISVDGNGWNDLPGIADVKVDKSQKIDVKSSPGTSGATLTMKGYDPAKVSITLKMHFVDEWAAWAVIRKSIEPRPGKKLSDKLGIRHPETMARDVASVVIEKIATSYDKPSRTYTVDISAIEWFPQPKASATKTVGGATKVKASVDAAIPDVPTDAAAPAAVAPKLMGQGESRFGAANAANADAANRRKP